MKKTMLVFLGAIFGMTAIACQGNTTTSDIIVETDAIIPAISAPDTVFFDGGTYQVTYGDLYDELKTNDGLNKLLDMVDTILLASYIDQVGEEEINDKINFLKYSTSDPDEIAKLTDTEKADYDQAFQNTLQLAGYAGQESDYARKLVAEENYAYAQMSLDDNNAESWYVGPSTIADYYSASYYQDISTIKIRFMSETEGKDVMKSLNLVGRLGHLYRYTGIKPIGDVPSDGFDDTNTVLLEGDDLLLAFIQMYNVVYGSYRTPLAETATFDDLVANPDLKINYNEQRAANANLNVFMYRTLGDMETYLQDDTTALYYTYVPVKYYTGKDTSYYMILNLQKGVNADVSDFDGDADQLKTLIGADTYDLIEQKLIQANKDDSGYVSARLVELRAAHNFKIYDYYLGMDYQSLDGNYVLDEVGDETLVATYDATEITADDLFYYAMNENASLYLVYAAQMPVLMDKYFAELYCDSDTTCIKDIVANQSDKMKAHRTALTSLKTSFEQSYYSYYYTFEQYIFLAYGATSEDDMLKKYYVESALQPFLIYDELKADDWAILEDFLAPRVTEYYDNYFSLDVTHLLIYIDRNEDGSPDDYNDFLDTVADRTAYDNLLADFETAIYTYLDDPDNTFSDLVLAYSKAKYTDPVWGVFKDFGFYLTTEDLSADASLTYLTAKDSYDPDFVIGLEQAYQEYILPDNSYKTSMLYDEPVASSFGVHILKVAKGDAFSKPSAKYTMTYNSEMEPNYTAGIDNTDDMLSLSQMEIYAQYRFIEMVYGTSETALEKYGVTLPKIPYRVQEAIDAYYADINDSFYVIGSINFIVSDLIQSGTMLPVADSQFTFESTDIIDNVGMIGAIYYNQVLNIGD